jgi:hypothetical protein
MMLKALLSSGKSMQFMLSDRGLSETPETLDKFYFDGWVIMLFRAYCWGACHDFVPGGQVPLEWWQSKLPIYIG